MRYEKHIFICANQKEPGKVCCTNEKGMELVEMFRESLKARGLNSKIRAQRAGCLDACKFGPSLVIYPEGTYYGGLKPEHVEQIIESHICNNKVVTELEIKW